MIRQTVFFLFVLSTTVTYWVLFNNSFARHLSLDVPLLESEAKSDDDVAAPSLYESKLHYSCSPKSVEAYKKFLSKSNLPSPVDGNKVANHCNCIAIRASHNKNESTVCFPTFFIIGVSKCGTSSLHYYLMEDERFISSQAKEVWHTYVPFARKLFEDASMQNQFKKKTTRYLSYFHLDGGFKSCSVERHADSGSKNNTNATIIDMVTCEFRYHQEEKYRDTIVTLHNPIADAFSMINKTIPPSIITKDNPFSALPVKRSVVSHRLNSSNDTNIVNSSVLEISQLGHMLMTGDGTPDYHFYADIPSGLFDSFPTSKIVLLTRDMLSRSISTFRYVHTSTDADGARQRADMNMYVELLKKHKAQHDECIMKTDAYRKNNTEFVLTETNIHWVYHMGNDPKAQLILDRLRHGKDHYIYKNYLELFRAVNRVTEPCHFQPFIGDHNNIFSRFRIYSHMQWWLQFYAPEQILVIDYGLLTKYPKYVVNRVLNFLELRSSTSIPDYVFDIQLRGPMEATFKGNDFGHSNPNWWKQHVKTHNELTWDMKSITNMLRRNNQVHVDDGKSEGKEWAPPLDTLSHYTKSWLDRTEKGDKSRLPAGEILLQKEGQYGFHPDNITVDNIEYLSSVFKGYDYISEMEKIEQILKIQCLR